MSEDTSQFSLETNDLSKETSPYSGLYKYANRTIVFTFEKKRQLFLDRQKERRIKAFDEKRNLSQLFHDESEAMELESTSKPTFKKYPFRYKLMKSEWFTEIPDDLNENWLIKLCPEGIRYLVIANKAITTCYYRNGRPSVKFKSKLPGGDSECPHRFTVLDCIYNKDLNTLFVYDVLAWNSLSLLNVEAQMRFFWLKSKFTEEPEMCIINKNKNFNFILTEFFPAEPSLLQDKFFTPSVINDKEVLIEGILFYHKEGHYVSGRSPLVGWLKSFMVPEVLHIDVHPSHLKQKPEDYENVRQYLSKNKKKEFCDSVEMQEVEDNIECEA